MESLIKNFGEQNEQMCQKIEQLEFDKAQMVIKMKDLAYENSELKDTLEEKTKSLENSEVSFVSRVELFKKCFLFDLF